MGEKVPRKAVSSDSDSTYSDAEIERVPTDALPPTHPGEILREELAELNLSANAFAAKIKVPTNRITQILAGRRSLSAETALRLARFFGTSAQFWMNLQTNYDLKTAAAESGKDIVRQVRPREPMTS
jgi:addiction module HigA family antidote